MLSNKRFKGIYIFCFKDFTAWVMRRVDDDDTCFVCYNYQLQLANRFCSLAHARQRELSDRRQAQLPVDTSHTRGQIPQLHHPL